MTSTNSGFFEGAARVDILEEDIVDAREAGVPPASLIDHLLSRSWRLEDCEHAKDSETRKLATTYRARCNQREVAQIGAGVVCFLLAGGFALIALAIDTTIPGV